ncbi:MAG: MlaD family protein [Deltaproteobacteria bacterium]|jgi:ABC-type transporter Mla subunit MlaD|nr:MlaD family protein [Deltaproteobacteria bacterium]
MTVKANYVKIGIFTISALAILTAAVLYFGLSSAFKPSLDCQTYFNHTVQGLAPGSSVNFRGFKVGQVSNIALPILPGSSGQLMVRVEFTVEPSLLIGREGVSVGDARGLLEREIANKLRCFLSYQGVSGLSYLNLDYLDGDSADEPVPREDTYKLVIPSARGAVLAIGDSLSKVLRSLSGVDFEKLNDSLAATLGSVKDLSETVNSDLHVLSLTMGQALASLEEASGDFSRLANRLSRDLEALDLATKSSELASSLRRLASVLKEAESLTRSTRASLPATLENMRVMSENLREVSEMARRYPSQILFGQPPLEMNK